MFVLIVWCCLLQSYPHKILTGRRDRMSTLRQTEGLCGFTKRSESEYDCFGAGHSSTTISAGLGTILYCTIWTTLYVKLLLILIGSTSNITSFVV